MNEPITTIPQPITTPPGEGSVPAGVAPEAPVASSPVSQPQPATPPPVQAPKPKSNRMYLIIAGILCLGILITTILYLRTTAKPNEVPVVAVTPTIAPTPTPPPNISRIASTSAFAAYSEEIASFSAILNSFTLQDSTLAPPIMDTDLELSN